MIGAYSRQPRKKINQKAPGKKVSEGGEGAYVPHPRHLVVKFQNRDTCVSAHIPDGFFFEVRRNKVLESLRVPKTQRRRNTEPAFGTCSKTYRTSHKPE